MNKWSLTLSPDMSVVQAVSTATLQLEGFEFKPASQLGLFCAEFTCCEHEFTCPPKRHAD